MSTMERRLQLLLDQDRYDLVAHEADRSGRSVAAVIREAIDFRFPRADPDDRSCAAQELLALATEEAGEGPSELKRAYEDDVLEGSGR